MLLNLDDAVKVTKRLVIDGMDDEEIIRQELEQKCWFPPKSNKAAKHLNLNAEAVRADMDALTASQLPLPVIVHVFKNEFPYFWGRVACFLSTFMTVFTL